MDKLLTKLEKLMIVYKKNLFYTQEFQKRVYVNVIKSKSYNLGNKVWLNSEYNKIK